MVEDGAVCKAGCGKIVAAALSWQHKLYDIFFFLITRLNNKLNNITPIAPIGLSHKNPNL